MTSENIINLSDFQGENTIETFALAMDYMQKNPGTTLVINPGTYVISSELARKTREAVFNGDYGYNPESTMFNPKFAYTKGINFAGQKRNRVIAYGVTLMVDGFMEPVSLNNCEDIEILGLTIDHTRKPYSRGKVTHVEKDPDGCAGYCSIEFDPDFPIKKGTPIKLRFTFYDPQNDKFYRRGSNGIETADNEYIDEHHIRLRVTNVNHICEGFEFYTIHTYHYRPAILIEHAKNIRLTDVTIHSQPGMGIVGNRSENIYIKRLAIIPSCGDHWSTNTDATHFTSIKGVLRYEDCVSEAHGDDFINAHTYYHVVVKRESDNVCYLATKAPTGTHAQTLDYPDVGDTLEMSLLKSCDLVDTYKVIECIPLHDEWMCKVTLDHSLPESTDEYIFADITRLPHLEVIGCTITSHFARSVLIKTRSALIERNFFKNADIMAIEAASETWWYEGVCPANVVIRNNRIINCGGYQAAGIVVMSDAENAVNQNIFNIVIEDNIIDVPFADHAIYVKNTDGLKISRNKIRCKNTPAVIVNCINTESDI